MKQFMYDIAKKIGIIRYAAEERAVAAIETAILMPLLISLLLGCYDLGQGIILNQKTIGASQIIGDLVARNRTVTLTTLQDMIRAGELAYEPYDTSDFGYDIVSVEFDDDGEPVVLWRVTHNMPENDEAVASTEGLGDAGDGIVVVTTEYGYVPYFSHFVVDSIDMREVAFLRGRRSATVICDDCPG